MNLIQLLQQRKRMLTRFLEASLDFRAFLASEDARGLLNNDNQAFNEKIGEFTSKRAVTLQTLEYIQAKVNEETFGKNESFAKAETRHLVSELLDDCELILRDITQSDAALMKALENSMTHVRDELDRNKASNKFIGKFKSGESQPGRALDKKL